MLRKQSLKITARVTNKEKKRRRAKKENATVMRVATVKTCLERASEKQAMDGHPQPVVFFTQVDFN